MVLEFTALIVLPLLLNQWLILRSHLWSIYEYVGKRSAPAPSASGHAASPRAHFYFLWAPCDRLPASLLLQAWQGYKMALWMSEESYQHLKPCRFWLWSLPFHQPSHVCLDRQHGGGQKNRLPLSLWNRSDILICTQAATAQEKRNRNQIMDSFGSALRTPD